MLNEKGEQYRKLPKGQAFLTNKRLIFLSCEHMQSIYAWLHAVPRTKLTQLCLYVEASLRPRRGPTTFYELIAKEGDATVYVPIPLACVKGVELISYSVTASMAEIDATAGCCGGAFACFRVKLLRVITRKVVSINVYFLVMFHSCRHTMVQRTYAPGACYEKSSPCRFAHASVGRKNDC
jgi:hypothetical protein